MSSPSLTFFNGTDTVGGVQVLVRGETGKVVFDLGVVGNPAIVRDSVLFHDFTAPAVGRELFYYLRAGMAPPIERFYCEDLIGDDLAAIAKRNAEYGPRCARKLPLIDDFDPSRDAVFISHLHDDHAHLVPYLGEGVDVLMSADSSLFYAALTAAGTLHKTAASVEGLVPGEARSVGDLTIEAVPVDHDIPGASGLFIEAGGTSLFYTGDWRLHGSRPSLMEAIANRYAGRVDVLLTEASTARKADGRLVYPAPLTEPELVERFAAIVAAASGTVYCTFHEQNIERQAAIAEVARAAGRHLVVSPTTHALWSAMARRGMIDPKDLPRHVFGGPPLQRSTEAVFAPFVEVDEAEVRANRSSFICEVRADDRWRLLDTDAGPGDRYVHMNGPPFGSNDPGWPALVTWLSELGIELSVLSSHGHATEAALKWFAEALSPKLVIPVHTNDPSAFPEVGIPIRPVQRGESLDVA